MKAGSFTGQLQWFNTFFGLKLCQLIFTPTEQLSRVLEQKDITVQEAREAAFTTEAYLQKQSKDTAFDRYYDGILAGSANLTDEPVMPRKCKVHNVKMMELLAMSMHHQGTYTNRCTLRHLMRCAMSALQDLTRKIFKLWLMLRGFLLNQQIASTVQCTAMMLIQITLLFT